MGMRTLIETLRREAPEVEIGNFSRPISRASSATLNTLNAPVRNRYAVN